MTRKREMRSSVNGFSLIELLICIGLISVLLSIGQNGYNKYVNRTYQQQAKADLVQLAMKMQLYKSHFLSFKLAAGTKDNPQNTGFPWIYSTHSPSHQKEQNKRFELIIETVSQNGLFFELAAVPVVDNQSKRLKLIKYDSEGKKSEDKNGDGMISKDEECWQC